MAMAGRSGPMRSDSYPVGWKITYVARQGVSTAHFAVGIIAGAPVQDPTTETVWIPVTAEDAPPDRLPQWVRHTDVVDVAPAY